MKPAHASMWPRITAELVIIVLGVSGALIADEWREARQDRRLEAELLRALASDISADIQNIDEVEVSAMVVTRATSSLLATIDDPLRHLYLQREPHLPVDVDSTTVDPAGTFWVASTGLRDFEHERTTFDEMVATGTLRVIRNQELRRSLVDYYARAGAWAERIEGRTGALSGVLDPVGISPIELRHVDNPMTWLNQVDNLGFLLRSERGYANARVLFLSRVKAQGEGVLQSLRRECGAGCAS